MLAAAAAIAANFFVLNGIIDVSAEKLEGLPSSEETENMTEEEKENIVSEIEKLEKMWKKYETFLCSSMEHDVSRDFVEDIATAKSYLESGEYADYAASVISAQNKLEHMKYDEGIGIGNIL